MKLHQLTDIQTSRKVTTLRDADDCEQAILEMFWGGYHKSCCDCLGVVGLYLKQTSILWLSLYPEPDLIGFGAHMLATENIHIQI